LTYAGVGFSPAGEAAMARDDRQVLCPACHSVITVEAEWRLAQCPKCHEMVTRMGEDSSFD
jgi:predicted RNA-binding Zn-ribbon protein involved in translation (DUF1610 family)